MYIHVYDLSDKYFTTTPNTTPKSALVCLHQCTPTKSESSMPHLNKGNIYITNIFIVHFKAIITGRNFVHE